MKISAMVRFATALRPADRADFDALIATIKRNSSRPGFGDMLDLTKVAVFSSMERRRLYGLCRRYAKEIAIALGYQDGQYLPAEYHQSGSGPFGRENRNKSGRYDPPMLWLKKT
jgi:hypothetical protein